MRRHDISAKSKSFGLNEFGGKCLNIIYSLGHIFRKYLSFSEYELEWHYISQLPRNNILCRIYENESYYTVNILIKTISS